MLENQNQMIVSIRSGLEGVFLGFGSFTSDKICKVPSFWLQNPAASYCSSCAYQVKHIVLFVSYRDNDDPYDLIIFWH